MKILDKKKSIEQPANNVYFIEKIKGHPVRNIFISRSLNIISKNILEMFVPLLNL